MHNYQTLIEKAKKGFASLDLPKNFRTDALTRLETWLTDEMFVAYQPQIEHLVSLIQNQYCHLVQ